MSTIDTSTPALKAAQQWINAYIALDIDGIAKLLPKHHKHQVLPKSIGLPEESKEEYIQRLGGLLASLTDSKVRGQHQTTALKFADWSTDIPLPRS